MPGDDPARTLRYFSLTQKRPCLLPPHALETNFAEQQFAPLVENEPPVGSTASLTRMIRRFHNFAFLFRSVHLKEAIFPCWPKQLVCLIAEVRKSIGSMGGWTHKLACLHRRNPDPTNIQEVVLQKLHAALYRSGILPLYAPEQSGATSQKIERLTDIRMVGALLGEVKLRLSKDPASIKRNENSEPSVK